MDSEQGDAPEVDAVGVPVPGLAVGRVEVLDTVVASSDDPIIRDLTGDA